MEIKEIIEENLKEAVENNDEEAVKYWGDTYTNYFGTLLNAYYKKTCSKCGRLLLDSEFNKCKPAYKGLQNTCRNCLTEYQNTYYETNKEEILKKREEYRDTHKEEIKELRKRYHSSMHGKILRAKKDAKRRGLGFNLLYPIPKHWQSKDYCFHHINDTDVVALPKKIHAKYSGIHFPLDKHREMLKPYIETIYKNKKKAS